MNKLIFLLVFVATQIAFWLGYWTGKPETGTLRNLTTQISQEQGTLAALRTEEKRLAEINRQIQAEIDAKELRLKGSVIL